MRWVSALTSPDAIAVSRGARRHVNVYPYYFSAGRLRPVMFFFVFYYKEAT
jgi:hypothetical protein